MQLNGVVKKITGLPTLKIVHDLYNHKQCSEVKEQFIDDLEYAKLKNPDLKNLILDDDKSKQFLNEDLLPLKVSERSERALIKTRACEPASEASSKRSEQQAKRAASEAS